MSKKFRGADEEFGNESFLDVMANMVGVLLIIIFVGGHQMKGKTEELKQKLLAEATEKVNEKPEASMRINADVERLEQQIAQYDRELAARTRERGAMLIALKQTEEKWQEKQQQLAEKEKAASEFAGQRRELLNALQILELEGQNKPSPKAQVVALEHLPTPMAQTVFNEEIHLRLKAGRLSVVPLESLLTAIKEDFQRMLRTSVREGVRGGMVGPIRDYSATYQVETTRGSVSRGSQMQSAVKIELLGLVIEPTQDLMGETMDEAVQPQSQLAYELAGRDPHKLTVTVWVYPDSFAEFRRLKQHLFSLGYATAARPLPEGKPITGGPQGSRSTAQ